MREHNSDILGKVDLDDLKTYDYLPDNWKELDDLMFKEIGYYYCYVNYFHPDWCKSQEERCNEMIKGFCDDRGNHYDDIAWMKEKVFLFQDETENMC